MITSVLRIPKKLPKASSGIMKATANGQPAIDASNIHYSSLGQDRGGMIIGFQDSHTFLSTGYPKVPRDGSYKFNYPMDFEGESHLRWDYVRGDIRSTARTGSITIEFSLNQNLAVGSFEFTTEDSIEIKGTFDVQRDD